MNTESDYKVILFSIQSEENLVENPLKKNTVQSGKSELERI